MSINSGSANQAPLFTLWPRIGSSYLTGANATLSGTPLPQWIISAGDQGTLISRVEANAVSVTRSSIINLFLCNTAGLTGILWRQYPMGIISATVTSTGWATADTAFGKVILPSGWTVHAALSTAGTTAYVKVWGEDY